ncbi:retrotransposon-related protein [Tanacetum coccineum]
MFSIRIQHGGKFRRYPGRMYVNGHVDIFDIVDIDLFTIVVLNMMVVQLGYTCESEPLFYNYLRPLNSLEKRLYALACEEDVRCLATIVRSFKLIEVYIEHGVMALESYIRPLRFRATIEEITDESGSIAPIKHRSEKMLLLTWHDSCELTKEPVCESVTHRSLPKHDSSTHCKDSVYESVTPRCMPHRMLTPTSNESVINDVMRQLSFEETKLDGEAGFADVADSGVESSGLSHDESFGVDDLDLNLNEPEPDVGRTQEPIVAKVRSQEPIMEEVRTQEPTVEDVIVEDYVSSSEDAEQGNGREDESTPTDGQTHKKLGAKAKAEREIKGYHVLQYSKLRDYVVELQSTNLNTTIKIAVERNTDPSLPTRVFKRIYYCLGALKLGFRACRREMLGLDGAFMKGSFLGQVMAAVGLDSNNGIYPLAFALLEAESKSSWCWFLYCLGDDIDLHPNSNFTFISNRQKGIISAIKTVFPTYKDLLWRSTPATSVKEFEKCMLELKTMNPKAHEWLNKIPPEHWARSHFSGRAKSDLFLNNICEVFNGKIVGGRDKPVITLLEYITEYCMKRIMNIQSVIDKCNGPLTPTVISIIESIKKEAHLMKVQWNGANKYQVSGLLGDQCGTTPRSLGKSLLLVEYMEGNILSQGRPKKKRKKSKHKDEPFVKDDKLKASGSASRQAQQAEPVVGQDGSGGSGVGAVIVLSAVDGQGGGCGAGVGVSSQVPVSETKNADGREMGDGIPTQSSIAGGASEWSFL